MRRDRTLKICTNHCITPMLELKAKAGSDRPGLGTPMRSWLAHERPKPELLAIRFLNAENAQKFKAKFEESRKEMEQRKERIGQK